MGTFYVGCRIENVSNRSKGATLPKLLVDTGSEYTWVPEETLEKLGVRREKKNVECLMANGKTITRSVGFAIVRLENHFTVDEVVFGEKHELLLLGSRALTGLNIKLDPHKKLVADGSVLAASGPAKSLLDTRVA